MRVTVLDTETTGLSDKDEVCELAMITSELSQNVLQVPSHTTMLRPVVAGRTLVRPRVPISDEARAVHHISNDDVSGAPTMDSIDGPRFVLPLPDDVSVAHNMEFDARMITQSGGQRFLARQRICTWRCSLHMYPEADRHSNQFLRYWLALDVPPLAEAPHRALADAIVTHCLLERMLVTRTIHELLKMTGEPVLLHKCRLPAHRDKLWKDVPSDYMNWILRKQPPFEADIVHTCRHWMKVRSGRML